MSVRGRKSGQWVEEMEAWLAAQRRKAPLTEPIPPSRDLAARYEVNHTSVFRQLQRLEENGLLWKAANGRFYFAEARFLVEKPKPIACLFRKIENWSMLYQELMEGIAGECEARGLASLLWHEEALVRHSHPGHPPMFADTARQKKSLARFVERYGTEVGGLILDHVWSDAALAELPEGLHRQSVVLCRAAPSGLPAATPDFRAAASLAFTHLFAMGYRRIQVVRPFRGDPSVDHALHCVQASAAATGIEKLIGSPLTADSPTLRAQLIQTLARRAERTGLIFLEDNNALLFREHCQRAGLECPDRIGILSLQGTRAAADLTHTRTSYAAIGKLAVELSLRLSPHGEAPRPVLVSGETTAACQG